MILSALESQQSLAADASVITADDDAEWYGMAHWFIYKLSPKWSAGLRYELVRTHVGEVQEVGADWIGAGRSLALRLPSAICEGECNVLLNPEHQDYAMLSLLALRPLYLDERLRS